MKIAVMGAGAVGCYYGGLLARAGHEVVLIGRAAHVDAIRHQGLRLDTASFQDRVMLQASTDAAAVQGAELVLFCVKSTDTTAAAAALALHLAPYQAPDQAPHLTPHLAPHLAKDALVLSLQNGVGNADTLRVLLPQQRVVAGMVGFNVVQQGEGRFHCGSEGVLGVPATGELAALLGVEGLDCEAHADMTPVLWGKLLMNLNNALNALSGLPLLEQLKDRAWRRLLATMMDEALAAMDAAGIHPAKLTVLPAWMLPHVLRLPTPIYSRVAASMMKIDPHARSSMWEDLQQGRITEVGYLQGAVLALAQKHGRDARLCARVIRAVQAAEAAKAGSPHLQPSQLV